MRSTRSIVVHVKGLHLQLLSYNAHIYRMVFATLSAHTAFADLILRQPLLRSLRHNRPKATITNLLDAVVSVITDLTVGTVILCFAADINSIRRQAVSKSIELWLKGRSSGNKDTLKAYPVP